jgi:hypothetical protein
MFQSEGPAAPGSANGAQTKFRVLQPQTSTAGHDRQAPSRASDHLLQERWPREWRDGARSAFLGQLTGEREQGGYPREFHAWSLDRRNAWFGGFNRGYHDRLRSFSVGATR